MTTSPVFRGPFEHRSDTLPHRSGHIPSELPATMTVAEARVVLAASGVLSLPVADHHGLIGLITAEALSGGGKGAPAPDTPIVSVMDWHLVRVPPDADEASIVHEFSRAAWAWLYRRAVDVDSATHPVPPAETGTEGRGATPQVGAASPLRLASSSA